MQTVGIYAKINHPDAPTLVRNICTRLQKNDINFLLEPWLGKALNSESVAAKDVIPRRSDLIIVLGGDGTLISVARQVTPLQIPILGVNLGSLGFLTEITQHELPAMLEMVLTGQYEITDRMMLDVEILRQGKVVEALTLLNDAVINKGTLARIIDMQTRVDGNYLTTFKADGLIVSTPTGSTGYNLAAGGPIIYPGINSLVITPICPHMLTNRPLIVSSDSVVAIDVSFTDDVVYFTGDGQIGASLEPGDRVQVRQSTARTYLIKSPNRNYFEILRAKLSWGER
ncbi:NAD(+)/NADH kinase [Geopsychrobacter electrodiphilus]|uniref:NAD(+)/NADH kinase n=1 Tax=Geopsychrobacter electrodiphilus TaxID=225196 RepID=UPI000475CB04